MENESGVSEIPLCVICKLPLGPLEIATEGRLTWHLDCQRCQICTHEMPNVERIQECIAKHIDVSHLHCFENRLNTEIREKTIPVTQSHLDVLNETILSRRDPIDPNNLEAWYTLLRSMQQAAANISILLHRAKDKAKIKQAVAYREDTLTANSERRESSFKKELKKVNLAAERADPERREKRKAVEGLMKLGITETDALAILAATPSATTN